MLSDNTSVSSYSYKECNDTNKVDEVAQEEAHEEKLKEAIDGLSQKSLKGRISCFEGIQKMFVLKYIPDFIEDRKMTITDSIERSLKRGKGEEQSLAARLSTLLCIQLGDSDSAEMICTNLRPCLSLIANDNTASANSRLEVKLLFQSFISKFFII